MRTSTPYTEVLHEQVPSVHVGDFVEQDDGWWRAHRITIWMTGPDKVFRSEVDWVPVEPYQTFVTVR